MNQLLANRRTGEVHIPSTWVALAVRINQLNGEIGELCSSQSLPECQAAIERKYGHLAETARVLANLVLTASERESSIDSSA